MDCLFLPNLTPTADGVQSSCVEDADGVHCPTSFMNPVNYGNAWNKSLARELGYTIAIESRALWVAGAVEQSPRNHIGLDACEFRDSDWD